jgi:hypothetical protein
VRAVRGLALDAVDLQINVYCHGDTPYELSKTWITLVVPQASGLKLKVRETGSMSIEKRHSATGPETSSRYERRHEKTC